MCAARARNWGAKAFERTHPSLSCQRLWVTAATTLPRSPATPTPQASLTHGQTWKELQASRLNLPPHPPGTPPALKIRAKGGPRRCLTFMRSQNSIVFYGNKFTRPRLQILKNKQFLSNGGKSRAETAPHAAESTHLKDEVLKISFAHETDAHALERKEGRA